MDDVVEETVEDETGPVVEVEPEAPAAEVEEPEPEAPAVDVEALQERLAAASAVRTSWRPSPQAERDGRRAAQGQPAAARRRDQRGRSRRSMRGLAGVADDLHRMRADGGPTTRISRTSTGGSRSCCTTPAR